MQNYYQFIIPRLNGEHIRKDFKKYLSFVHKGIAGFIIFGGKLETVRRYIGRLQDESEFPLIISSDLERGLGQQLMGGTLFPPSMAISSAVKKDKKLKSNVQNSGLLKKAFEAIAEEARYAGINTIFAPVLDINTNPKNPIISIRSFGEDRETVSAFGCEAIRILQRKGVVACGKHFPGHGDTEIDSHIRLPVLKKTIHQLRKCELYPFKKAIEEGVGMIMSAHLSVPALDASGTPVSISDTAVKFIRRRMKYDGILITDAMNMGGLSNYSEEEASFMALKAGMDIILHPSDPDMIASYLSKKGVIFDNERLIKFRKTLSMRPYNNMPDFEAHRRLSERLSAQAINIEGNPRFSQENNNIYLLILNDGEDYNTYKLFIKYLKKHYRYMKYHIISGNDTDNCLSIEKGYFVVVSVFSETRAWKGGAGGWLHKEIERLKDKTDLFVSFGSPYLINYIKGVTKMYAYWGSDYALRAAAAIIAKLRVRSI